MHLHTTSPRIYESKYHGTKTTYWKVKCELPHPSPENPGGKRTYQKKHATEAAAQFDRMRLIREYGGGSISAEQLRDYELANHRLDKCTGDAHGKSVLFAVDWFIKYFEDPNKSAIVEDAIQLFNKEHLPRLRAKSREEYNQYLGAFSERFGKFRLAEIKTAILQEYVDSLPAKLHRRKCLIGFFAFCSGGSRKIPSQHKWIQKNPANHVRVVTEKTDNEVVILSIDEVKNALAAALMIGDLGYWIWGLFTGMRPEEIRKFWSSEDFAWERINLHGEFIVVNSEISKVKRRRKIIIRPNLRAWLDYFRATGEPIFPTCHRIKFREVKRAAVADRKFKVNDIIRHTFVSYRAQAFDKSLAATAIESGNSERIIRDHYLDLVPNQSDIEEFWSLTPASFGLIAPVVTPITQTD